MPQAAGGVTAAGPQLDRVADRLALLDAVFHASHDAIYSVDAGLRFTSFNFAYERLVALAGRNPPRIGDYLPDIFTLATERERSRASLQRALEGEHFVETAEFVSLQGDKYWLEINRTPIVSADGTVRGVANYSRDVTVRASELALLKGELEAFAYSVSHDLRAPLRAIDGFARLLERDHLPQLPLPAREHFSRIRGAAQRMGELIEGLLNFSKLGRQPMKFVDCDVAACVGTVLDDLAPDLDPAPAEISVAELGRCSADKGLLTQVFANLVGNAIKYSRGRKPARIQVGSELRNGRRTWFVADNGVGFDMAHAGRLFGVFQRLHHDEEFSGTGVGLALVRRIVERHGGRVWAEAVPGTGATFYFTLAGS